MIEITSGKRIKEEDLIAECDIEGLPYNSRLLSMVKSARSSIAQFCRKRNCQWAQLSVTDERTSSRRLKIEPMYYFTDDSGGYTLAGIKSCLRN